MPSLSAQVHGKVCAWGRAIAVGTECSGTGLESMKAALGHGSQRSDQAEVCLREGVAARKLILVHQKPDRIYGDITPQRPVNDMIMRSLSCRRLPVPALVLCRAKGTRKAQVTGMGAGGLSTTSWKQNT